MNSEKFETERERLEVVVFGLVMIGFIWRAVATYLQVGSFRREVCTNHSSWDDPGSRYGEYSTCETRIDWEAFLSGAVYRNLIYIAIIVILGIVLYHAISWIFFMNDPECENPNCACIMHVCADPDCTCVTHVPPKTTEVQKIPEFPEFTPRDGIRTS